MSTPQLPRRLGPRPLPLHLTTALNCWLSCYAGLPLLKSGSIDWRPEVAARAARLRRQLAAAAPPRSASRAAAARRPSRQSASDGAGAPDPFDAAVANEIWRRLDRLAAGIRAYRAHPYRRDLPEPPTLWRDGTTRLLDFRPDGGRPVLFVPSLVNRAYILDLSEQCSLLRWLAGARGLRPLLVDWDAPSEAERRFSLTDYVAGRLDGAFAAARAQAGDGGPLAVVGYCMGGLLALALALRRRGEVSRLALLATPWDFHAERARQAEAAGRAVTAAAALLDAYGELPVDVIQALFANLDPFLVLRKFIAFASLDPRAAAAARFVALEDWLNDGVPLAAPVARECLGGWYGDNAPARRQWRIAGNVVDPARFAGPALVLLPQHDRIVPPGSAQALADALPNATVAAPAFGHIGMVAGARARSAVWRPLADWLAQS